MGLKFRRGSTAQQSGSLAFGEPYVNTTLGTLVVGGPSGDIVLSAGGTGSTGNFGAISGSGLDITGNANIAGNLTLGGQLQIGDQTTDTVNVVASLSSSLIPQTTAVFDLGSADKIWRHLYISTGSIKFVGAGGTVVSTLSNTANGLNLDGGIVTNGNSSFGTSSLSVTHITGSLRVSGSISLTGSAIVDRDILLGNNRYLNNPTERMTIGQGKDNNPTNVAIGRAVLDDLQINDNTTAGMYNVGVGSYALTSLTTGKQNTSIGESTLLQLQTGDSNTALGDRAGNQFFAGSGNTFIGAQAARMLQNGSYNIGMGWSALLGASGTTTDFVQNIAIGVEAGQNLSGSSSSNIIIGKAAGPQSAAELTDRLYIGHMGYPLLTGSLAEGALSLTINGETQISGAAKATSFSGQILANNGVLSGSLQSQLPAGVISGSSQVVLSSTNGFTTYSTSVDSRITTEKGRVDAILSAADADKDTFAEIVTLINSVDLTNDTAFASFYTASVGRLGNLESKSASVDISVSNLNTYTGSNNTTNTTQNSRLTELENSASAALSTNNTQATSITNLNTTTASLNVSVSNLNTFSGSALTRLSALEVETSNLESFSSSALTRLTNLEGTDITITLTGDVTGTGTITNLGNVSFATTVAANQVALGTDTTGDYVASLVQGTGVTITNNSGESATPTIAIGQAVATSSNVQFNSLGIGMAASATAGRIDATNDIVAYSSSDIRFKENITPIENALDKISKISGNTYDWKAENKIEHGYEGNDVGVIAQEIEAVLPQLVQTRENGFKAVKYDKLVALLIQGIKEQQVQIEELKAKIGL